MQTVEITNEQKVELFDKYFPGMLDLFLSVAEEQGYKTEIVKEYEIADEMLCQCLETSFVRQVIESIEDSVSMEEYGFVLTLEDEE